ncbi:MAG: hypothetical protein QM711_14825 [Micropruina sp.]|uniref:hypothetical protein n=1 Tax=Micropruina sp. TaxID=2737536 RepID=UPI0039E4AA3D
MISTEFPRDLFITAAIFGIAAFAWAGWGQERPLKGLLWRLLLSLVQLGGAVTGGIGITQAIRNWGSPTAIVIGGPAFVAYIVTFWLEIAAIIGLAVWATRRQRKDLYAPLALAVVGVHFIPLAWVFAQPIYAWTGVITTVIAVVAWRISDAPAARSFWCGLMGGATLLVVGAACLLAAR